MKTSEINIRDPFILLYKDKYYMYGSRPSGQYGFEVYISDDLENWSEPKTVFKPTEGFWGTKDFWAPEVHLYNNKFYMLASFKADGVCRGTSILVSDSPDGMFTVHAPRITPKDWECLDGTLYVENKTPYMIFCHEWIQIHNGEIWAVRLSDDLKEAIDEPFMLWKAGDANWISSVTKEPGNYVTDGPFLYKTKENVLKCLWSSFSNGEYALATATSTDGINGTWSIDENLLYEKDGGHGMIFKTKEGKSLIVIHSPNQALQERPKFIELNTEEA